MFQFLLGRLETPFKLSRISSQRAFQFLLGRLETDTQKSFPQNS